MCRFSSLLQWIHFHKYLLKGMKFTVPPKSLIHVERYNENEIIFVYLTLEVWRVFCYCFCFDIYMSMIFAFFYLFLKRLLSHFINTYARYPPCGMMRPYHFLCLSNLNEKKSIFCLSIFSSGKGTNTLLPNVDLFEVCFREKDRRKAKSLCNYKHGIIHISSIEIT